MNALSKEERNRYQRFIELPEMGESSQLRLKNSSTLVVGAGGLGSALLPILCASGIGHIGLVEHDTVDHGNLQRQTLYTPNHVGTKKINRAGEKLAKYNPNMHLETFDLRLDQSNAPALIARFDVVADCTDNFPTRYLINDLCGQLGVPLIYGSLSNLQGQLTVLHHEQNADLRDLYPEPPADIPDRQGIIPSLPHIIGSMQANETLKLLTHKGHLLDGRLLIFNAYNNDIQIVEFK